MDIQLQSSHESFRETSHSRMSQGRHLRGEKYEYSMLVSNFHLFFALSSGQKLLDAQISTLRTKSEQFMDYVNATSTSDRGLLGTIGVMARARLESFDYPIETARLGNGERLEVTRNSRLFAENGLLLLYCDQGAQLTVGVGLCGLWCPLRGELSICEAGAHLTLAKGLIYVSDSNRQYEALTSIKSACIAVVASQATWSAINAFGGGSQMEKTAMFPAIHVCDSALRRAIVASARELFADPQRRRIAWQISIISSVINRLQQSFDYHIDQCPGRTLARRRNVFLRLQRSRLYIMLCNSKQIDVSKLADIASYSKWQFIKLFKQVFGTTPYVFLSRYRVEVAKTLLTAKAAMSVSDIARAVGFGSKSSFTRVIRQRIGESATQYRSSNVARSL
jgi:AraC family transcriptional regulator